MITNNKIGFVTRNGINLHNARDIDIFQNTVFYCPNLLSFSHDNLGDPIENVTVRENTLITITDIQKSIKLTSKLINLLDRVVFKDNVYHHPISNDFIFQLNETNLSSTEWSKHEPSHKTVQLKPNTLKASESGVFNLTRHNLLDNQSKRINSLNKQCKVETSNDFVTITTSESMTGVKIDLPDVKSSKNYSLKVVAKAEGNFVLQAYLRTAGSPWATISEIRAFNVSSSNQERSIQFSNVSSTSKPVLMLKVQEEVAQFKVSELVWIETDATPLEPSVKLRLNDSSLLEEIQIDGHIFYLHD
jgi:hypothetical protein